MNKPISEPASRAIRLVIHSNQGRKLTSVMRDLIVTTDWVRPSAIYNGRQYMIHETSSGPEINVFLHQLSYTLRKRILANYGKGE